MSTAGSDGLGAADEFDLAVDAALQASELAALPAAVMARLRLDAVRSEVPAGRVIYRAGDQPRPALVVSGMVRLFITTPEGREVNLAYARSGELIGVAGIIDGPSQVSAQAFTDTRLWRFGLSSMREVAAAQPQLALALARQLLDRLYRVIVEVRGATFGDLRSRVARHLLDLAAERQTDHVEAGGHAGELVAPVTHQQLADAVGSVRQTIGKVLAKLHTDGLVEQTRHGVVLVDPEALRAEGWDGN